jgi:hypothetical protein
MNLSMYLFLFILLLFPNSSLFYGDYFKVMLLLGYTSLSVLIVYFKSITFKQNIILYLLFLMTLHMLILAIINLAEINIRIFLDGLKYIYIATIILFGYLIIYLNTLPIVMKNIVIFFKYFIIIEIIICIDQLFLFNSFYFLYEYERSRSI